eukprot:4703526-Karenia_brevis.AAC.1
MPSIHPFAPLLHHGDGGEVMEARATTAEGGGGAGGGYGYKARLLQAPVEEVLALEVVEESFRSL